MRERLDPIGDNVPNLADRRPFASREIRSRLIEFLVDRSRPQCAHVAIRPRMISPVSEHES